MEFRPLRLGRGFCMVVSRSDLAFCYTCPIMGMRPVLTELPARRAKESLPVIVLL